MKTPLPGAADPIAALGLLFVVCILLSLLPLNAFVVGDSGVKLVAARAASQRPTFPIEIPLPVVGHANVDFVDPFFRVHGDHSHAVVSGLFPLLVAPLLDAFGYVGLYIWSACAWVAWCAGWGAIGKTLDHRRDATTTTVIAALGTPLLFYGLEFWEHAPAAAMTMFATLLLLRPPRLSLSASSARVFGGILFGVAFLLRPEAFLVTVGTVAAVAISGGKGRMRMIVGVALGACIPVLPVLTRDYLHFGGLAGVHLSANAALLVGSSWLETRADIIRDWLLAPRSSNGLIVAPALLLLPFAWRKEARRGGWNFLALTAGITTALVLLSAPNDGGGQWGPRYLLPVYGPLTVLASDGLSHLDSTRAPRRMTVWKVMLILVALVVQGGSVRKLYQTKHDYAAIASLIQSAVPERGVILTDVWWIDQVAASVGEKRTFLFVENTVRCEQALRALRLGGLATLAIVRSDEGGLAGRCFAGIKDLGPPTAAGVRGVSLTLANLGPAD